MLATQLLARLLDPLFSFIKNEVVGILLLVWCRK